MGGFNVNTLTDNLGIHNDRFSDIFSMCEYFKLIKNPTRITNKSKSLIDNIYTNIPITSDTCMCGTIETDFSDHYTTFCTYNETYIQNKEQ